MPATTEQKITINLLTQDRFSSSLLGKIMLWALSIGRYIVIFTELIVILSFLSRFKLDRELTDLNESINQQQSIIQSYGDLEIRVKQIQAKLEVIRQNQAQISPVAFLEVLSKVMPEDVDLEEMTIDTDSAELKARALSTSGFIGFIKALYDDPLIDGISLDEITSEDQGLTIEFILTADIKAVEATTLGSNLNGQ